MVWQETTHTHTHKQRLNGMKQRARAMCTVMSELYAPVNKQIFCESTSDKEKRNRKQKKYKNKRQKNDMEDRRDLKEQR